MCACRPLLKALGGVSEEVPVLGNEDQWPVSPRLVHFPTEALAELAVVETTDETNHMAPEEPEEI